MATRTFGQDAFDAYNAARGGLTHDGKLTPPWEKLGPGVQAGWEAAARAVVALTEPKDGWAIYESILAAIAGLEWIKADGLAPREIALVRTKLEEAQAWLERAMLRSEREGHRASMRRRLGAL